MTLIITLMILIIFTLSWSRYKIYHIRKTQLSLYKLRDKLRQKAYEGSIEKNQWMFDYLDSSISKTICNLPFINLWNVILLLQLHKNNKDNLHDFKHHLELAYKKNKEFKNLHQEFSQIILNHIIHSHIIIIALFIISHLTIKWLKNINKFLYKTIDGVTDLPENSTSEFYAERLGISR
jgi:hypothetical protein